MTQLRVLAEVFRSPDLRRLQIAWFATSTGVWCAELVLAIYAYQRAGAGAVGVMALVRTLPGAPVAPVLTWIADRVSRRAVMVAVEKDGTGYIGQGNSLTTKCPSKYQAAAAS